MIGRPFLHNRERLASTVTQARTERHWTIATLAQRAGVGPRFIESIEAAEHRPELAKVLAVLNALDIEPRAIPTPHHWTAGPDPDGTSHEL